MILIMKTVKNTKLGSISEKITSETPLTDFEIDIKKFDSLLMKITIVVLIFLFGVNLLLNKPLFDFLLFNLIIAVI